jgi:polyhydroxyalkanoate synthesis regulator phasin
MLAQGKITTEEADRLISALREQPSAPGAPPAKKPRYLRVIVDAEDSRQGPVKVNIRVPLMLLRAGVRLASVIPPQAQEKVNRALREQGVDFDISTIKPENLEELIDELQDLTVDIEQQRDDVKVKVFVE